MDLLLASRPDDQARLRRAHARLGDPAGAGGLSWVQLAGWRPPSTGPLRSAYDMLFDVTEPPLRLLRRILPPAGMFDLSVVVLFIIIFVLRTALC
jgi:hypothetical protein